MTGCDIAFERVFHTEGDATAGTGCADHKPHVIGGDLRVDSHVELTSILPELPAIGRTVWRWAPADTTMGRKFRRMLRLAETLDVGRRGEGALALIARDGDANHVLIDDFAQPHPSVIAFRDDVEFLVRYSYVNLNCWKGIRETRQ